MSILQDRAWKLKYTPDHGDLVKLLYEPLLESATRYDRLTGYFSASALALAARGVEGLVLNGGRMRMVVGCTLDPPEIDAIQKGEELRAQVDRHLTAIPLMPTDPSTTKALELLAWMVAQGRLEVRVGVPCDARRKPVPADGLFHEKSGIVEDKTGDKIAFNGSLNETAAGWTRNWESLNVFTSWGEPGRVIEEDENFARLWTNQAKHVITMDVPTAAREDLLRFLPADDVPARLKQTEKIAAPEEPVQQPKPASPEPPIDLRRAVWEFIAVAPTLANGGDRVGEATSAVTPWPYQVRAFHRMYDNWPPRLLIADEVGLGKTIEAGLLLRQAWLARKAERILILAPKNVCAQWQIELREKLNLNWPIYDGQKLSWYASHAKAGQHERAVSREEWHEEPIVIASSHLMRRADRQTEILEMAAPWDLVILDEAHHARRRGAGSSSESGPNAMLRLMRGLRERTKGLLLLTATPMQVHPVEVFDLLSLLGLPREWTQEAFLRFFDEVLQDSPSHEAFDDLARMFRSVESTYGEVAVSDLQRLGITSTLRAKRVLNALRDRANTPRRQLETADRKIALRLMRLHTPVGRLISRHTRALLRRYFKEGKISTPIADRRVEDRFIDLSPDERVLYEAVEDYISTTYNQASVEERNAIGFVMTIYRRRLASSFFALRQTLESHLEAMTTPSTGTSQQAIDENLENGVDGDEPDVDEAAKLQQAALALEEHADIERLLMMIRRLPPDSKSERLRMIIGELRDQGYSQVMVFTQFTDTLDFLRGELGRDPKLRIMCFSGRGGEAIIPDHTWRKVSRDDVKRRFREGDADLLLCTDAAAEGLNFQFCGALINYDMPWNPMRVEQRIGRIDRLGQRYPNIRIVNLHYADTVEADVYRALRQRIGLFENVIGRLQPILARLPTLIGGRVLTGRTRTAEEREAAVNELEGEAARTNAAGFDIDTVTDADLAEPVLPAPPVTMDDLERVISVPALLPQGIEVRRLGAREYAFRQPGLSREVRISTDPAYYEQNADDVELWSPGNPTFPELLTGPEPVQLQTLADLLQQCSEAMPAT
jgi:SNF2 family DNA or RNA helicase